MVSKANKAVEDWVRNVQTTCPSICWESIGSPKALVPVCKNKKNRGGKCIYKRCPKVPNKVTNE